MEWTPNQECRDQSNEWMHSAWLVYSRNNWCNELINQCKQWATCIQMLLFSPWQILSYPNKQEPFATRISTHTVHECEPSMIHRSRDRTKRIRRQSVNVRSTSPAGKYRASAHSETVVNFWLARLLLKLALKPTKNLKAYWAWANDLVMLKTFTYPHQKINHFEMVSII